MIRLPTRDFQVELEKAMKKETPRPQTHQLENAMMLILAPNHEAQTACVSVAFPYGDMNSMQKWGLPTTHFLEHMFRKGTTTRSVHQMLDELDWMADEHNAFTAGEMMQYFQTADSSELPSAIAILADQVQNSTIAPERLALEYGPITQEYARKLDSPTYPSTLRFSSELYGDHPAGRRCAFTEEEVRRITREILLEAKETMCKPDKCALIVYGDFNPDEAISAARESFEGFTGKSTAPEIPEAPLAQEHKEVLVENEKIKRALLWVGVKKPTSKNMPDLDVVSFQIGRAVLSRKLLFALRTDSGLTYGVSVGGSGSKCYAYTEITTDTKPDDLEAGKSVLTDVLRKVADGEISEDDVALAKYRAARAERLSVHEVITKAHGLAFDALHFNKPNAAADYLPNLRKVTLDGVRAALQKYMDPDKALVLTTVPKRRN